MKGEAAVYHVSCRSALDGFALGDGEKEQFVKMLRDLSQGCFVELLGFSVMGNHAHVPAPMHTGQDFSDDELRRRRRLYSGQEKEEGREVSDGELSSFREKWGSLSEFVKDLKQRFSRWYNKSRRRRGFSGARGSRACF